MYSDTRKDPGNLVRNNFVGVTDKMRRSAAFPRAEKTVLGANSADLIKEGSPGVLGIEYQNSENIEM